MPIVSWNRQSHTNAVERKIKEPKKGLGHKMLATGVPRSLCDEYLELELYTRSHSVNSV